MNDPKSIAANLKKYIANKSSYETDSRIRNEWREEHPIGTNTEPFSGGVEEEDEQEIEKHVKVSPKLVKDFIDAMSKHFQAVDEHKQKYDEFTKTEEFKQTNKKALIQQSLKRGISYDKNKFKLTSKGIKPTDPIAKTFKASFNYPEVTDDDTPESYAKKLQERLDLVSGKIPAPKHEASGSFYDWGQAVDWGDDTSSELFTLDPDNANDLADQLDEISKLITKSPNATSQSDNDISIDLYDPTIDDAQPTENNTIGSFTIDITKTDPQYYKDAAVMVRKYKDFAFDTEID